jgi:hypothetical protein
MVLEARYLGYCACRRLLRFVESVVFDFYISYLTVYLIQIFYINTIYSIMIYFIISDILIIIYLFCCLYKKFE